MRHGFIAALLLLASLAVAPAQAPDTKFTATMPNGRFWLALNQQEKKIWLIAYADGIKTAAAFVNGAEPDNKLLQQAILDLQPNGATPTASTANIVAQVDHFYQDAPENISLPIVAALNRLKQAPKR